MDVIERFAGMSDPRRPALIRYPLGEVVTITLCALLAGADDWGEVAIFCTLRSYLATLQKQGHSLFMALTQVFLHHPVPVAWGS